MSVECIGFTSHQSGALQGFANFRVARMGVEMFGCSVFMKNGKRWVSLPSREYTDPESSEKKYISVIRFIQKDHMDTFSRIALEALDEWCKNNAQEEQQQSQPEEDMPF